MTGDSNMDIFNKLGGEKEGQGKIKGWEDFINKVEKTSPKQHSLWYSSTEIALLAEKHGLYSYVLSYRTKEELNEVLEKFGGKARKTVGSRGLSNIFRKVSQGYFPKRTDTKAGNVGNIILRCSLSCSLTGSPEESGLQAHRDISLAAVIDESQYGLYGVSCPQCRADILLLTYPQLHHPGLFLGLFAKMFRREGCFLLYRLLRPMRERHFHPDEIKLRNQFVNNLASSKSRSALATIATSGVLSHSIQSINGKPVIWASKLNRKYPKGLNRVFRDQTVSAKRINSLLKKVEAWIR